MRLHDTKTFPSSLAAAALVLALGFAASPVLAGEPFQTDPRDPGSVYDGDAGPARQLLSTKYWDVVATLERSLRKAIVRQTETVLGDQPEPDPATLGERYAARVVKRYSTMLGVHSPELAERIADEVELALQAHFLAVFEREFGAYGLSGEKGSIDASGFDRQAIRAAVCRQLEKVLPGFAARIEAALLSKATSVLRSQDLMLPGTIGDRVAERIEARFGAAFDARAGQLAAEIADGVAGWFERRSSRLLDRECD